MFPIASDPSRFSDYAGLLEGKCLEIELHVLGDFSLIGISNKMDLGPADVAVEIPPQVKDHLVLHSGKLDPSGYSETVGNRTMYDP
jgi:hypothetical protein